MSSDISMESKLCFGVLCVCSRSSGRAGKPIVKWTEVFAFLILYCPFIILHYHKLLSFALTFRPCFILKPLFVINSCQVQSWFESRKEDSAKASKNVPEILGASRPLKAVESSETRKGTSLNYLLLCILSPTLVFFHCKVYGVTRKLFTWGMH